MIFPYLTIIHQNNNDDLIKRIQEYKRTQTKDNNDVLIEMIPCFMVIKCYPILQQICFHLINNATGILKTKIEKPIGFILHLCDACVVNRHVCRCAEQCDLSRWANSTDELRAAHWLLCKQLTGIIDPMKHAQGLVLLCCVVVILSLSSASYRWFSARLQ